MTETIGGDLKTVVLEVSYKLIHFTSTLSLSFLK